MIYPKLKRHLKELESAVNEAETFRGLNAEPEFFDSSKFPNYIERLFRLNTKLSAKTVHDPLGLTSVFPEIKFSTENLCMYTMYRDFTEEIKVVPQGWCHSRALYLGAMVHECIHATGVMHRLKRNTAISGLQQDWEEEECVAQTGAYLLLKHIGLADDMLTKMTHRYLRRHNFLDQNKDKLMVNVDNAVRYILERLI